MRLYPLKPVLPAIALPDFAHLQRELSRPGVTRLLLWQEYKAQSPQGLQYSAFCDQYRQFCASAEPVMRFDHRAGEKCFVDYAGQTVDVIDRHSGEILTAQIFVAVLGCSRFPGQAPPLRDFGLDTISVIQTTALTLPQRMQR